LTTLLNYFFDRIYFEDRMTWYLYKYPEELIMAVKSMINKGKKLTPDPIQSLSLEVGYITEFEVLQGNIKLSITKMLHNLLGQDPEGIFVIKEITKEVKRNMTRSIKTDEIQVDRLNRILYAMVDNKSNEEWQTNGMTDWTKVLNEMEWSNYQYDLGRKVVLRIQQDYPKTLKEIKNNGDSYCHNVMAVFSDYNTIEEDTNSRKGNYWLKDMENKSK
jgi:hypothetical protein|tara:strand:+ start:3981 stop:4631 length:651 start_codon:yes stop_codon:yes gene_type:complete